jgi:hypothetical protein
MTHIIPAKFIGNSSGVGTNVGLHAHPCAGEREVRAGHRLRCLSGQGEVNRDLRTRGRRKEGEDIYSLP